MTWVMMRAGWANTAAIAVFVILPIVVVVLQVLTP
jgi:hypothetical protein